MMKNLIPLIFIVSLSASDSPTDEEIEIDEELSRILDFNDEGIYSDYNDIYPWNEYEERKRCAGPLWGSNKRKKNKA